MPKEIGNMIIFLDGIVPSVYFPSGKPEDGGTCSHATEGCLEYCTSLLVTNDHEKRALKYFEDNAVETIVSKIIEDLSSFNDRMLQWFTWGDCREDLTYKIFRIILGLRELGIVQYGFTRNKALWVNLQDFENIRFGLSVENMEEAKEISEGGLVCCPDPDRGEARIHYKGEFVSRCSGWWCEWIGESVHNSNCWECVNNKKGCFYVAGSNTNQAEGVK